MCAQAKEYWGLRKIGDRMGWKDLKTPINQMVKAGFPMYQRRNGSAPRQYWYTTEALIQQWELSRCAVDRQIVLERWKSKGKIPA